MVKLALLCSTMLTFDGVKTQMVAESKPSDAGAKEIDNSVRSLCITIPLARDAF